MRKKVLKGLLSLALASSLTLTGPADPTYAASFKDINSHWSKQAVEKSYALDLMKGYPGDVFKPEDPVSRLEAIAIIIRGMGLEKDALSLDYKNSGVNLPKGMTWGQGHLVLATQKGLLHKDYVNQLMYNNPITRQEVASLVAVALKDKLKVKGDPQKLTFKDTSQISVTFLPYVADVSQNDIMQGIENNEFGPNQIMKRGQMSALMVKTTLNGWFDYGKDKIVTGTLTGIDSNSGIATVVKSDGTQIPRLVDSKTVYYRGTTESSQSEFKAGDQVVALVGSDAKIKYIESGGSAGNTPAPATETELTGKILDRSLTGTSALKLRDTGYRVQSYTISPEATVTDGTAYKEVSSLTDGQYVAVKIRNSIITSIRLLQSVSSEGEVTAIYSGYFTLKTGSTSKSLNAKADELKIIEGNNQYSFSNLRVGDRIRVTSVNGEAFEIIRSNSTLSGEVRGVDNTYGFITIRESNGNRKEYEVELRALITKGNDRIGLGEIKQGDKVNVKVESNGKISEIIVTGDESRSISGTVTDLRTGSSPRIYISSTRYDVSINARVTRDNYSIDLDDIMIGAKARVTLDNDNMVTSIDVTDDEDITVEGTIDSVNESTDRITIEQSNGLEFTLRVNSNFTIRDQTSSSENLRYLDDLRRGWDVRLYLTDGKVTEIRVLSK